MRYRTHGKSALETRVDYVESKLDESINSLKEAIAKSENGFKEALRDNKEAMQQMENRHQANFTELKASLQKTIAKTESSRRWAIGAFITIAVAVIGFLLTNGFQAAA